MDENKWDVSNLYKATYQTYTLYICIYFTSNIRIIQVTFGKVLFFFLKVVNGSWPPSTT